MEGNDYFSEGFWGGLDGHQDHSFLNTDINGAGLKAGEWDICDDLQTFANNYGTLGKREDWLETPVDLFDILADVCFDNSTTLDSSVCFGDKSAIDCFENKSTIDASIWPTLSFNQNASNFHEQIEQPSSANVKVGLFNSELAALNPEHTVIVPKSLFDSGNEESPDDSVLMIPDDFELDESAQQSFLGSLSPMSADEVESLLSSPASPDSDIDYVPASSRKARSAPRSSRARGAPMDRKERKKQQNKDAATRYRQKKRGESEELNKECDELEHRNNGLKNRVEEMEREIKYLKDLMVEVENRRKRIKLI